MPQTVKNVEVEVDPEGQSAGTYLIITFDTETGDLAVYINLTQLLPVYTAGNNGIVISSDYQVSLKLAENSGLEITGNGLGISHSAIRKRLTGDATYYMDAAAGSDGNDGATADKALQSFAGLSALLNSLDSAGHDITIQLAAGTYTNCKLTPDSPLGHKLIFKGQAVDVDNLQYGANLEGVDFYSVRAVFNDVGFTTTARAYFYRSHISFFGDIRVGSALQFSVFSSAEAGYIDPAGVRHLATFNVIKASLEWVVGVGNYSNFSGMSAGYPLGLVFYQNTSFSWGLFYISNSTIYTSNWVLPAPDYAITGNNSFVGIQFSGLFHGTVTTKEAFLANWPNKKATFTECTPGSAIVRFSNAVLPYKLGPALQTVDNTTPGFYVKVAGADGGMVTVPSGGSWLVKVSRRRVADDAAMYTTLGGIVAGGTSFTAGTGYTYDLECWRIE